jgi:cyclophilin family peptidyl-prolyl cis-trans isomerase
VKYGQELVIAIEGSNVDRGLRVSSSGCRGMAPSTTPPYASTDELAYYTCTASAVGAHDVRIRRTADGALLAVTSFSVEVPQVTMTVANGAGVTGSLVFTLAPTEAPVTVDNFLHYVNGGFYAGTIFHRVVPGFVLQGGGYLPIASGAAPVLKRPDAPIPLEVDGGLSNRQWTVAMARTADPDSATSQFFVNLVDNSADLDPDPPRTAGYAVFGRVMSEDPAVLNVLDAIVAAPCSPIPGFSECAPNPNLVITAAVQTR